MAPHNHVLLNDYSKNSSISSDGIRVLQGGGGRVYSFDDVMSAVLPNLFKSDIMP